jgi:hypothetical protein
MGARGPAWASLRASLSARLQAEDCPALSRPGLTATDLDELAAQLDFERLARCFPTRGNRERITQIAAFGSQLADIALPDDTATHTRHEILVDGALFNVAVACFDTIVDEHRVLLPAARGALAPQYLRDAIVHGRALERTGSHAIDLLIGLFDVVLRSAWRRIAEARLRANVATLLESMYESELGLGKDALAAKTLPTIFIGEVSCADGSPRVRDLFARLAHFLALLDDWQDIAMDLIGGRPNVFLGGRAGLRPARLAWSAYRLLGGRASHRALAREIEASLDHVLGAARHGGHATVSKTVSFLRDLVEGRR